VESVAAAADSFPHQRHTKIACVTCHLSDREHGKLSFERPRGCQICHHQQAAQSNCVTCHQPAELGAPRMETIHVAVNGAASHDRGASFSHQAHSSVKCIDCHTAPVTLRPDSAVRSCSACHASHHDAATSCASCHGGADLRPAHLPAAATHTGCDRCHDVQTVSRLVPRRSLCLTCHSERENHYPATECTSCHFQESPDAFRRHLTGARS
jgi:hypothetical protein